MSAFKENLDVFRENRDAGRVVEAMEVAAEALRASSVCSEQAEWYRMQAELAVEIGRIEDGIRLARRALQVLSCDEEVLGDAQVDPRLVKLKVLELLALHVDNIEAPVFTAAARQEAYAMLSEPRYSEAGSTLWNSIALMATLVEDSSQAISAYRKAIDAAPPGAEQVLLWLNLANAVYCVNGFHASFEIVMEKVLPALTLYPELKAIAFSQVGDLFLGNDEPGSAIKAYEAAILGLDDDPVRKMNRFFVADLHYKLSWALWEAGDSIRAIRQAEAALTLVDANTPVHLVVGAHLVLGHAKRATGQGRDALLHYQTTLSAPDCPPEYRQSALDGMIALNPINSGQ